MLNENMVRGSNFCSAKVEKTSKNFKFVFFQNLKYKSSSDCKLKFE